MPPILPPAADAFLSRLGGTMSRVQGFVSQQDMTIGTASSQLTYRTGQLQQYPTSGTTWTSGYGWEILQPGSGSIPVVPVVRGGQVTVTVGGVSTVVYGIVFLVNVGGASTAVVVNSSPVVSQPGRALNTVYTPNASHSTWVTAVVTLGGSNAASFAYAEAVINQGSNVTVAVADFSTSAATGATLSFVQTLTFLVPAGATYQIASATSGGGSVSLNTVTEYQM